MIMPAPSHSRHHPWIPGKEIQTEQSSAMTGEELVLPSAQSMSVRRGPSPVRSVNAGGDHLSCDTSLAMPALPSSPDHHRHSRPDARPKPRRGVEGNAVDLIRATSTQRMRAPARSSSQERKAGSDTPKLFRSAAAKATAFSSLTKMTESQGPKPIRQTTGSAVHLFCVATHSMPLPPSSPNRQRHDRTSARPNPIRAAEGKAVHLFYATSSQPMPAKIPSKRHRCIRESRPSKKMGQILQFESHYCELPAVLQFDHGCRPIKSSELLSLGIAINERGSS